MHTPTHSLLPAENSLFKGPERAATDDNGDLAQVHSVDEVASEDDRNANDSTLMLVDDDIIINDDLPHQPAALATDIPVSIVGPSSRNCNQFRYPSPRHEVRPRDPCLEQNFVREKKNVPNSC